MRDSVFGEFTGQKQPDGGLNLSGGDGLSLVVVSQSRGLSGDPLKDVVHERVHDRHGLGADSMIPAPLVKTVSFPSFLTVFTSGAGITKCVGSPKEVHAHGNRSNQIKSIQLIESRRKNQNHTCEFPQLPCDLVLQFDFYGAHWKDKFNPNKMPDSRLIRIPHSLLKFVFAQLSPLRRYGSFPANIIYGPPCTVMLLFYIWVALKKAFLPGVLGHSLGSLRDSVFGEFTGQKQPDGGLDLSGGDGLSLVVVSQSRGLSGDPLKDVVHERVHDRHGLGADSSVRVDLLEDLVDVDGVRLLPLLLSLLVSSDTAGLLACLLLSFLSRYRGHVLCSPLASTSRLDLKLNRTGLRAVVFKQQWIV
eukprot:sb/3466021/